MSGNNDHKMGRSKYHATNRTVPYNHRGRSQYRFPEGWTNYSNMGTPIADTRFIAFKTPLSTNFFLGKSDEPFGLHEIYTHISSTGKRLGLVIDLTATTRYYNSEAWEQFQVKYVKISCPGHDIEKDPRLIKQFKEVVHRFLEENKHDPDLLIGVHCTHGLNRTGFLICHYLISCLQWDAEKAIKAFELARGYEIERPNYKRALKYIPVSRKH